MLKPNARAPRLPTTKATNTRIQGEAPPCGAAPPVLGKPTTAGTVGVFAGVETGVFAAVETGVFAGIEKGVFVGVETGVFVGIGTAVFVGVGVFTGVETGVFVGVAVSTGVDTGVFVGVAVFAGAGVKVSVRPTGTLDVSAAASGREPKISEAIARLMMR